MERIKWAAILLILALQVNAYPQYSSKDCGSSIMGKSASTFDAYSNNLQFFTTVFIDAYYDSRNKKLGTYEEYHHSVFCPKALVPCYKTTGFSEAYLSYASSIKYKPGVRGKHYWKHPNGSTSIRYSSSIQ